MPSQYDLKLGRAGEAIRGGLLNFLEGGAPIRSGFAGLLRGDVEPLKQAVGYGQPFPQLTPEQMQQQSLDVAMDINNPMQNIGGILGTFAGVNAKTANLAKLKQAEKLKAQGIPDAEIWQKTGWTFAFPDSKPRFEISDDLMTINPLNSERVSYGLNEIVNNPDVMRAYPSLSKTSISKGSRTYYSPELDAIKISGTQKVNLDEINYKKATEKIINKAKNLEKKGLLNDVAEKKLQKEWDDIDLQFANKDNYVDLLNKSSTLHEMQHAIQKQEKFAKGGSPVEMGNEMFPYMQAKRKFKDAVEQALTTSDDIARSNALQEINYYRGIMDKYPEFKNLISPSPEEAYLRLAGESEARLTQARINMTPEQRMAQYPYNPEYFMQATGVPFNELIVRGLLD